MKDITFQKLTKEFKNIIKHQENQIDNYKKEEKKILNLLKDNDKKSNEKYKVSKIKKNLP